MSRGTVPSQEPALRSALGRLVGRVLEPRFLGPLVGAAAVMIACVVIHNISGRSHLNHIRAAIAATPLASVAWCLFFTVASFAAMSLYDVMAVRRVAPDKVPTRLAVFAGFVGYGISTAIGFHVFVGGPVRYRIYQSAGLDAAEVGSIVGISLLTFLGGLLAILSCAMMFDPVGIPALQLLSPSADRILGASIALGLVAAIAWLARGRRQIVVLGWRFPLPSHAARWRSSCSARSTSVPRPRRCTFSCRPTSRRALWSS